MTKWMSEWVQGMYGYVAGGRRKSSPETPSPASSVASSAGALRRKNAQRQQKKKKQIAVLGVKDAGVKKRTANPRTSASKRGRRKGGADRGSDANSDADVSSQRITAAEQAAVNAEGVLEPVERLDRADPQFADWTDTEIVLFNNLQDRGLEPILPTSFKLDFPTLPKEIFTSDDAATLINSRKGNDLHAIRALQNLFKVGSRMRPLLFQGRHAPAVLVRAVNAYIKWAMDDADLTKRELVPVLTVKANQPNEKHHGAIKRTRNELSKLAARHRERYQAAIAACNHKGKQIHKSRGSLNNSAPGKTAAAAAALAVSDATVPPVLFGIILVKGVMTFCALDASVADAKLQTIALFDWAQSGQDVWNGLAVAILVMMVRDYQESLGAEMKSSAEEDDPDA